MFSNFLGISFKSLQILQFAAWTVETGVRLTQSRLIFCQMISYQGEMVVGIRSWSPTRQLNSKMERKQLTELQMQTQMIHLSTKFSLCLFCDYTIELPF